jgi:hypothetical protein
MIVASTRGEVDPFILTLIFKMTRSSAKQKEGPNAFVL